MIRRAGAGDAAQEGDADLVQIQFQIQSALTLINTQQQGLATLTQRVNGVEQTQKDWGEVVNTSLDEVQALQSAIKGAEGQLKDLWATLKTASTDSKLLHNKHRDLDAIVKDIKSKANSMQDQFVQWSKTHSDNMKRAETDYLKLKEQVEAQGRTIGLLLSAVQQMTSTAQSSAPQQS